GGTALFQDLYNSVNDWMYRDPRERDHVDELSGKISLVHFNSVDAPFFQVVTDPSPFAQFEAPDVASRERILFRLGTPSRIVLSDVFSHPGGRTFTVNLFGTKLSYGVLHPLVDQPPFGTYPQGPYDSLGPGHRNPRGLTGRGQEFISALMRRGMLVDAA